MVCRFGDKLEESHGDRLHAPNSQVPQTIGEAESKNPICLVGCGCRLASPQVDGLIFSSAMSAHGLECKPVIEGLATLDR